MAFAIVLETILMTAVSNTISISKLTSTIVIPHFSMGVCLICLACAVLWLRQPYGRVLNMFGVGIISMTPGGFILLVDFDDEIVLGELHHRNGFCHACGKHIGLCTKIMAFASVLETILITVVSSTISISKLTSTIIVPMIIWHGPRYGCGHSVGVCLICLA